jgi:hypothetical protein
MDDQDLRLDGNAAAGTLQALLGFEVTTRPRTCPSCHATAPLGAHHLYAHAPGIVVRCPACHDLALRVVRTPTRTFIELHGVLELAGGDPTL